MRFIFSRYNGYVDEWCCKLYRESFWLRKPYKPYNDGNFCFLFCFIYVVHFFTFCLNYPIDQTAGPNITLYAIWNDSTTAKYTINYDYGNLELDGTNYLKTNLSLFSEEHFDLSNGDNLLALCQRQKSKSVHSSVGILKTAQKLLRLTMFRLEIPLFMPNGIVIM